MPSYPFSQVDVFTGTPYLGNPVAVVNCLEAQSVPSDEEMARFANWTNLSETTFLLPPSKGGDYAVRIFTPTRELPFAGHPTLGTCAAFLRATHKQGAEEIVQECGIGLVRIKRDGDKLFFLAPEMSRYEPVDDETVARVCKAMGIETSLVQAAHWIVNGPQWLVLLLPDGETVRNIKLVDEAAANDLEWGIIAPQKDGEDTAHEVRAFALDAGIAEDPITGSLKYVASTFSPLASLH